MSRNRDYSICVNISGITDRERDRLSVEFAKAKRKYAPKGRAAEFSGLSSEIGKHMQMAQIEQPAAPRKKLLGWF